MKIFVCVKQVPDTSGKVAVNENGTLNRASMASIINPDDMNAVEAALGLKDETGCRVTAVTMGPPPAEEMLRELFAMGVDDGILITAREFGGSDTFATSQIIAAAISHAGLEQEDLILCGRQAIEGDTAPAGPQSADMLNIRLVTYAAHNNKHGRDITVKRMLEDGYYVIGVQTPCLITCISDLNVSRYQTVQRIRHCGEKEVAVYDFGTLKDEPLIEPDTIGLKGSPTNIFKSFTPPQKGRVEMLQGADRHTTDALVEKLRSRHVI